MKMIIDFFARLWYSRSMEDTNMSNVIKKEDLKPAPMETVIVYMDFKAKRMINVQTVQNPENAGKFTTLKKVANKK